jgi:hypothetical protein
MARGQDGKMANSSLPFCLLASLPFSFTISFLFTKVKLYKENKYEIFNL